jgi:hypothetical protein
VRGTHVNEITTLVLNNRVENLPVNRATIIQAAFNGERVGNFADTGSISWYVNIFFNGVYRVSIEYARYQGGEVGLNITGGMEDLDAQLPGTGGALQTVVLGYMPLMSESDPYPLTLTPTSFYNGEFAEFTSLILEWVDGIDLYDVVDGGTTHLAHNRAQLIGGDIRDEGSNIGFWSANCAARWPLGVVREGNYRVFANIAAPDGMGGIATLSYNFDRVHRLTVFPYTGDWGNYVRTDLGVIGLREGHYYFEIRPYDIPHGHFLNLRDVELVYEGEFAPVHPVMGDDVLIPVAAAVLVGDDGPRPENDWYNVGHFRRDYSVVYHLDIIEAGNFEVILRHSGNYGGHGYLHIDDLTVEIDVPHSGGWGTFVETSLGVFSFGEGEVTVTVAGGEAPGMDWFMNHSNIRLVRQ